VAPSEFCWHQPVALRFGAGCIDDLMSHLARAHVIVMAFERAAALGLRQRLSSRLGERLRAWLPVADGLSTMARARFLAEQVWPLAVEGSNTVLLAVGGGTTLDLAKVVRCRPLDGNFDAVAAALRGRAPWPALQPMALWLAPTTAGTGSEVTRWATVWDTDSDAAIKRSLDEPFGYAQRAYIDPTLTLSCPAAVTRDCALDALSHALEAIWNRHANPISDTLALSAARRIVGALPEALAAPQHLPSREALALAALEAGLAFSQTRTALAHALSYALTLEQGTPHGLACALWLPTAWRLAVGRDARVDRLLSRVFGGADAATGEHALLHWLAALGLDPRPAAWGITDAAARVDAALSSPRGRNFIGARA
jgi:phosphonate metabolism-associated iron-containing alcohol dehydrogenase